MDIVFCVFTPIVSTKCPSLSPASGEKKRKAMTEKKLKVMAQLEANTSVLSTSAVGEAKL